MISLRLLWNTLNGFTAARHNDTGTGLHVTAAGPTVNCQKLGIQNGEEPEKN
jgi:hypothetical protein